MALPGFRNHPKFRRLVALLRMPEAHVLGHVEMMWEVAYEAGNAVLGDSLDVELAAGWVGDEGALTRGLMTCGGSTRAGLIEETEPGSGVFQVHDLLDHAPDYVESRRKRIEEKGRDKVCDRCGSLFRTSDPKSRFCGDACRKADWRDRQRSDHATDAGRSATHGDADATQRDEPETDAGRSATQMSRSETNVPTTTRPDQPRPDQSTSTPFGGVGGLKPEPEKPAKPPKPPRVPSWGKSHDPEVIQAALDIMAFWPDHATDLQPTNPGEPRQKVPYSKAPLLALNLAEIHKQHGDLEVCKAIAQRAVDEWKAGSWIKAAQHFFGPRGPWEGYYRAHVSNAAQEEPPPSPPPRTRTRVNGDLRPLAEVAP